jgi:hypothetical protein
MFGSENADKIEMLERSIKYVDGRIDDERKKRWECEEKLSALMRHLKIEFKEVERHWTTAKLP